MSFIQVGGFSKKTGWKSLLAVVGLATVVACGGEHEKLQPQAQLDIGYPIHESRDNNDASRRWLDFRQIDRIAYLDEFKADDYRQPNTDTYVENRQAPPLDILMVVDNSGSMTEVQARLAAGVAPLLASIQNTDWQIYVVTTDSACPGKLIKKGDANVQAAFASAVSVGDMGDTNERGIQQAHDALANPCNGQRWLRNNSRLSIMFVSNEDNCSIDGLECGNDPWAKADYLYNYLTTIRRPGDTVRVYGIIFHPSQADCAAGTNRGTQYADLITRTGGTWESICDTDYTPAMTKLSFDARMLTAPVVPLTQDPRNGAITVTLDGNALPASAYQLNGRNVQMNDVIFQGQQIKVSYIYDKPFTRDFVLLHAAYPDTVKVETLGAPLGAQGFTYTTTNQTVSIATQVPLDPNQGLKVTYRENIPLRSTFFVGDVQDPSQIKCYLADGTEITTNITYDANTKTVKLSNPPTELLLFKCAL